ncbi:MAG: hypothetical protein HDT33_09830 [Clostridiales bacterium]|nr:hypothetical protein [Clostridiales bacterium]
MNNETVKIPVSSLNGILKSNTAFVTCASFEERSLVVAQHINVELIAHAFIFSTDSNQKVIETREKVTAIFCDRSTEYLIPPNDPFYHLKCAYDMAQKINDCGIKKILVDITTFTHEMLLILLNVLWRKKDMYASIEFVYTGAKEYCPDVIDSRKWLSKGCKEVRSVLGYPGLLVPKKQSCLIILVGFEHERASGLIDMVDPDQLFIGCGITQSAYVTSEMHIGPMKEFEAMHKSLLASRANVSTFDFSAKDIVSTLVSIERIVGETKGYNHIVVPMNTKISTLAVGMAALNDPSIQLCYAEPETYNFDNYSSPGDSILCYSWDLNK